jgi:hypothetical protein
MLGSKAQASVIIGNNAKWPTSIPSLIDGRALAYGPTSQIRAYTGAALSLLQVGRDGRSGALSTRFQLLIFLWACAKVAGASGAEIRSE